MAEKKFGIGPNPLQQEARAPELRAPPSHVLHKMDQWFDEQLRNAGEGTAEHAALVRLRIERKAAAEEAKIHVAFANEFHRWLLGLSSKYSRRRQGGRTLDGDPSNPLMTPWANKSLVFVPEVADYLGGFMDGHHAYTSALRRMRLKGPPDNVNDAWLYFKYLVVLNGDDNRADLGIDMVEWHDDWRVIRDGPYRTHGHVDLDMPYIRNVDDKPDFLAPGDYGVLGNNQRNPTGDNQMTAYYTQMKQKSKALSQEKTAIEEGLQQPPVTTGVVPPDGDNDVARLSQFLAQYTGDQMTFAGLTDVMTPDDIQVMDELQKRITELKEVPKANMNEEWLRELNATNREVARLFQDMFVRQQAKEREKEEARREAARKEGAARRKEEAARWKEARRKEKEAAPPTTGHPIADRALAGWKDLERATSAYNEAAERLAGLEKSLEGEWAMRKRNGESDRDIMKDEIYRHMAVQKGKAERAQRAAKKKMDAVEAVYMEAMKAYNADESARAALLAFEDREKEEAEARRLREQEDADRAWVELQEDNLARVGRKIHDIREQLKGEPTDDEREKLERELYDLEEEEEAIRKAMQEPPVHLPPSRPSDEEEPEETFAPDVGDYFEPDEEGAQPSGAAESGSEDEDDEEDELPPDVSPEGSPLRSQTDDDITAFLLGRSSAESSPEQVQKVIELATEIVEASPPPSPAKKTSEPTTPRARAPTTAEEKERRDLLALEKQLSARRAQLLMRQGSEAPERNINLSRELDEVVAALESGGNKVDQEVWRKVWKGLTMEAALSNDEGLKEVNKHRIEIARLKGDLRFLSEKPKLSADQKMSQTQAQKDLQAAEIKRGELLMKIGEKVEKESAKLTAKLVPLGTPAKTPARRGRKKKGTSEKNASASVPTFSLD